LRRNQYPNPGAIEYARTMPPSHPCQITTDDTGKNLPMHHHGAWLDHKGNGNTDVAAGHFHRVMDFRVLPDLSDGHNHQLTTLPCGPGMPNNVARGAMSVQQAMQQPDGEYLVRLEGPAKPFWTPLKVFGAVVLGAGLVAGGVYLYRRSQEA
jgi:hypothetical protein